MIEMKAVIIPIDPKTGKPRRGKWQGIFWMPDNPEIMPPPVPSNPNFVWGDYGRPFYLGTGRLK